MTIQFGSKGFQRDANATYTQIEPRIFALEYQSILANVAKYDHVADPNTVDIPIFTRNLDLQKEDIEAVRTLIESNNIKQYAFSYNQSTYIPQLYKIYNTVDALRGPEGREQVLAAAIKFLTMQHDAFALFNNHNKCFLEDTQTVDSKATEDIAKLADLINAYRQYNIEDPIIFMGYGASAKFMRPLQSSGSGGFRYGNVLDYLTSVFPNSMANYKLVNQYVLDNVTKAAKNIKSTVLFDTNDVVLFNPLFAKLFRGFPPNTITTGTNGDEVTTFHYFTTPSLQMISKDRAYKANFADSV